MGRRGTGPAAATLLRYFWLAFAVGLLAMSALLSVATKAWRERTGVALRLDVLPKRATLPLMIGLPLLLIGGPYAFGATGRPAWLIATSLLGAAVSVGFHLAFVRLHRRTA